LEVISKLQTFDTQRKARSESILKWAVGAARGLKDAFEMYIYKDIEEMKHILSMLSSVQQEVDDERSELKKVENEYLRINDQLNILLDSANRNKIKKIDLSKKGNPSEMYQYQYQQQLPKYEEKESS
jgi:hypothetical protein